MSADFGLVGDTGLREYDGQTADDPVLAEAHADAAPAGRNLKFFLVALDVVALTLAWPGTLLLSSVPAAASTGRPGVVWVGAFAIVVGVALIASKRLWLARRCSVRSVETEQLGQVALLTGLIVLAVVQAAGFEMGMGPFYIAAVASFALLFSGRAIYRGWLSNGRRRGAFTRPIVLVGTDDEALELSELIADHPELGFVVTGVVGPYHQVEAFDLPWLGDYDEAVGAVNRTGATGALVVCSALQPRLLNRLVRRLLDAGNHVHLSSGLRGISHDRLRFLPLAHEPLFYLEQACLSPSQLRIKRALDVVLASLGLLVIAPVVLVAALAIKLEDGGPVFFRQLRVGRDGKQFTLLKLRTMIPDAETQLPELLARNMRSGPLFKLAADPRVTRIGRWLRAMSVDELPQLVNVVRGDMSLVGPRPPLPREYRLFDDELQLRQRMLPGISGLWQVEARDDPSFDTYKRLDLFYVENWSVGLDLSILLNTLGAVVARVARLALPRRAAVVLD